MQSKSEKVPHLTRRDCGELAANRPKLPVTPLTRLLKRLWFEGHKQGYIAKVTGQKIDYVKKHTACFSRALNPSPIKDFEAENTGKEVQ